MKLKIWSKKNGENCTDDKQLFVRLIQNNNNDDIGVCVVDKKGDRINSGTIIFIDQDFKVIVSADSLSSKVPLKTDLDGSALCYPSRNLDGLSYECSESHDGGCNKHNLEMPENLKEAFSKILEQFKTRSK
jgi:hypothetical protein